MGAFADTTVSPHGAQNVAMSSSSFRDVVTARRHALGDLLRPQRPARPREAAVVYGDCARARVPGREREPHGERFEPPAACARATGSRFLRTTRTASWSASCALARLGAIMVPINFMLGADEVATSSSTPARRESSPRTPSSRSPTGYRRRARRGPDVASGRSVTPSTRGSHCAS